MMHATSAISASGAPRTNWGEGVIADVHKNHVVCEQHSLQATHTQQQIGPTRSEHTGHPTATAEGARPNWCYENY
jgi:hypothetical protein